MTTTSAVDRPAAIRRALRDLVADHGFHGASMSAVAAAAGVATGTAYVHYESKEELVYATYLEIKQDLGEAVVADLDPEATPRARYGQIWRATYRHLREDPGRARFLTQVEESPFRETAHRRVLEQGDRLLDEAARPDVVGLLVPLPVEVVYALSLGTAVRLASADLALNDEEIDTIVDSTWRAVTIQD
jgi:TetR/AcrR family transcriptional repressor of multidrug resistance operon